MNETDFTDTLDLTRELATTEGSSQTQSWRRISLGGFTDARSAPEPAQQGRGPAERRFPATLLARMTSIDALRDSMTGDPFFAANEEVRTVNVSRHGLCLRCPRPPAVGTRLLVRILLNEDERPVEFEGCVRWTRIEFVRGSQAARPIAVVGVELSEGVASAQDRYEQSLQSLAVRSSVPSVAAAETLR